MSDHNTFPDIACLFWFYKSPELCENRLKLLRKKNPHTKIYGLYGGAPDQAAEFRARLSGYLDDFYEFTQDKSAHWKWYHGDQMITDWFVKRGQHLDWDTIFIAQWDMLVFDSMARLFPTLKRGQILLSGLRPVAEVDPWWYYVRPDSEERLEYERFLRHVRTTYQYDQSPLCCEFIVSCLPRSFMQRYQDIAEPECGFLEYKIPVYAQIFSTPFCTDHPHQPWWGDAPNAEQASIFARGLNSETCNVPLRVIEAHRLWPWGRRIFHPVFDEYPESPGMRWQKIGQEIRNDEIKARWWRWHRARQRNGAGAKP